MELNETEWMIIECWTQIRFTVFECISFLTEKRVDPVAATYFSFSHFILSVPDRVLKAIFSSTVPKNGEVYTPETSCMKGTSLHIKNVWIKQLCNRKVRDFPMALRARKVSCAFNSRNGPLAPTNFSWTSHESIHNVPSKRREFKHGGRRKCCCFGLCDFQIYPSIYDR